MMNFRHSIRFKLIASIALLIGIFVFSYSVIVLQSRKDSLLSRAVATGEVLAETAVIPIIDAFLWENDPNTVPDDFLQSYLNKLWEENHQKLDFIVIHDEKGKVRAHSDFYEYGEVRHGVDSAAAVNALHLSHHIYRSAADRWILEVAAPIHVSTKSWGTLRMGFDAEPVFQALQKELWKVLLTACGTLFLVVGGLFLIITRITRKLIQTANIVNRIDLTDTQEICFPESDDEIGTLNETIRSLHRRLIASLDKIQKTNQSLFVTEKLAAVGRLAAGVAHEINNPLMGMKNCVYLIETDPLNPENTKNQLQLLNEGLESIESIVNKLLGVVRHQSEARADFDVNSVIGRLIELMTYRIGPTSVSFTWDLDPTLPPLNGCQKLFAEAMLNIIINALDAVGEDGRISCRTYYDDESIYVEVKDNGPGIPEENMERIYEPFFTTKEVGNGTGLGLYVTREIIQEMLGEILIRSDPGAGTTFTCKLMRTDR
ncbi:MAG: ATP-binding protein [Syntrophobacteraceae bacterium]